MVEATIWGLGEDQYGPRMDRAVGLLKRVADPEDRKFTFSKARQAMRFQKYCKRAKKRTVAKSA